MTKLVLIDGNAIMHRAFHAMPRLTDKKGEPIGAVYGLVSMLLKLVEVLTPTHIAVCFDRKEPTFRKKEYKAYQAQRPETDADLTSQFAKAKKVLDAMKIETFDKAGFEADDLIGTIVTNSKQDEVVIVTGDRDIFQLVDDKKKIRLYMPVKGLSDYKIYKEADVVERMGVRADQIIDFKALVGDPSDNYPGVSGIGPKTATNLLAKYKSMENIFDNLQDLPKSIKSKLEKGKSDAEMSQKLAKIIKNVPIKYDASKMDDWDLGNPDVVNLFLKIGFRTLTKRIGGEVPQDEKIKKNLSKNEIEKTVGILAKRLKDKQYAIRGSARLVLEGYDMVANDVDIICDKKTALIFNKLFKKELADEVSYKISDQFKSYFGRFILDNVQVEVMGNWQVNKNANDKKKEPMWSEIFDASDDEIEEIKINGQKTKITKIEMELACYADMGRWNAFQKLKKQVDAKNQKSLF